MTVHFKSADVQIESVGDEKAGEGEGLIKAVVSVFGNTDSYGDRITKGAFAETLKGWADKGDHVPFIWNHDWADPFSNIGSVVKAEETDRGLEVTAEITAEERQLNPKAEQVYRLLKARRVTQFSFSYDVLEGSSVKAENGEEYFELRKLHLFEVGPCLVGVNQETELLAAKALRGLALKADSPEARGKVREAYNALGEALEGMLEDESTDDEENGSPEGEDEPTKGTTPAEVSGAASSTEEPASGAKHRRPHPTLLLAEIGLELSEMEE